MLIPSSVKITFSLGKEKLLALLLERNIQLTSKPKTYGIWTYDELTEKIRFKIDSNTLVVPWIGKCSIKSKDNSNNHSILKITFFPSLFFLIILLLIFGFVIYSLIHIATENIGTSGFLPSIIIPNIALISLIFICWIISKISANSIKKSIIKSVPESCE